MFDTAEDLKAAIIATEPSTFVSMYMFEPVPYIFANNISLWIEWKSFFARLLQVDPRDIVLTGSSAVGFSLNPQKNFRPFSPSSDIDCGIISTYHFDIAWRQLRTYRTNWMTSSSESRRAVEQHRTNYVFSGTIACDRMLALLPFGSEWNRALRMLSTVTPTAGREIKLRIYRDFDALRQYQSNNIRKLRNSFLEPAVEQSAIGVED